MVFFAEVTQLVEQWTENPRVGSSILPLGTISYFDFYSLRLIPLIELRAKRTNLLVSM